MAKGGRPTSTDPAAFSYDVAVIGMGSVGLPLALSYYASGQSVLGVDSSADRLISVGAGLVDLSESDRELLGRAMTDERFQMTADLGSLADARSVIMCVPTPLDRYFVPDVGGLNATCSAVTEHARPGQLLILTSTTHIGSTDELLVRPLADRHMEAGRDIFVAFSAIRAEPDSTTPERDVLSHVVGGATPECAQRAVATLHTHTMNVLEVPSLAIAEMAKLLENTFRTVNLAFAEEFGDTG